MESEKRIFTFAFEGMHRAGKSTQIDLLKNKLSELGIPSISIRGEGYRTGTGDTDSNPESDYWQKMTKILQDPDDYEAWNEASYRLARELIVWRDRVLSRKINETLQPFGVLLVDRSLISNAFLKKLHTKPSPEKIFTSDDFYPKHLQNRKKISADMVLPDMIIELLAPKEVLLSRLKKDDPDYSFRKKNVDEKYDMYLEAKSHLPMEIQQKIVSIDSSQTTEGIFSELVTVIKEKFPELNINVD